MRYLVIKFFKKIFCKEKIVKRCCFYTLQYWMYNLGHISNSHGFNHIRWANFETFYPFFPKCPPIHVQSDRVQPQCTDEGPEQYSGASLERVSHLRPFGAEIPLNGSNILLMILQMVSK